MSEDPERAPLGFRVLLVAAALYLAVRLAQGVKWLWDAIGPGH